MGNQPSQPSESQVEELRSRYPELIARAARAISDADILLLCTGAGWSADSGLPVYRDVADVAAYHDRGLTYRDICQPSWVDADPSLFYGFWGTCFNDYRDTPPHEGYSIVRRWADSLRSTRAATDLRTWQRAQAPRACMDAAGCFFCFTSNVDAHSLRVFEPTEVYECHGNLENWQCADAQGSPLQCPTSLAGERDDAEGSEDAKGVDGTNHAGGRRATDREGEPAAVGNMTGVPAMANMAGEANRPRRWAAPPSFRFAVDAQTRLADDGDAAVAADAPAAGFGSNRPRCVHCGGCARPAVMMFMDDGYVEDEDQCERWAAWRSAVAALAPVKGWRVVVLEVGCGANVTTVRSQAESLLQQLSADRVDATLVCERPPSCVNGPTPPLLACVNALPRV